MSEIGRPSLAEQLPAVDFEQLDVSSGIAGSVEPKPDELIARALADLEEERRKVLERARTEGYEAGLAEAREALAPSAAALAAMLEQLELLYEERCAQIERRAAELSLYLAERVIGAVLELEPELVLANVTGALRAAAERDRVLIEVNPDDLELVRSAVDELAARVGGIRRLEVVGERRVERGGCIARTAEGEIDARIQEKLALAREAIEEALERRRHG